ncbi:MAG: pilus assembly protein CpaF, partial [Acetivibrio ethanolgignens]
PDRNIVTFRETADVSGQEGLDFSKKSDGTVSILGEVASNPICCWLISMAQVASLFTLFTHHAKTTENLVISMRNALLLEGGFHDEKAACRQVTEAIRFDVHMKKGMDGHRYIEHINEIVPEGDTFSVRELVCFREGRYVKGEGFSTDSVEDISFHLEPAERKDFQRFIGEWENEGLVSASTEASLGAGVS